jgi:hypothetical protein
LFTIINYLSSPQFSILRGLSKSMELVDQILCCYVHASERYLSGNASNGSLDHNKEQERCHNDLDNEPINFLEHSIINVLDSGYVIESVVLSFIFNQDLASLLL